MNTCKLLFVTQFPSDPERPAGGVEAVSVNLLKGLSKLTDLNIQILTLSDSVSARSVDSWLGMPVYRLPRPRGPELINAVYRGRRLIEKFADDFRPDIIHAHDTYGIMTQNIDMPKVFTIHGFIHCDTLLSNQNFSYLRCHLWRHIELANWNAQPNIISISPYVRERVSQTSSATIFDIENPISDNFFDIPRDEKKGLVFTSAIITPRKNLFALVKAVEKVARMGIVVELRVAGDDIDPTYARSIKDYVTEHNLQNTVTFLGRISSAQIRKELSQASIYALASLEENSPIGIEEAMAAGVPILTSNRCGMPYMVRNLESGFLVDPNNIDMIATKIAIMLSDDATRKSMGEVSTSIARTYYHADRVAARTKSVYDEIISR